MLMKEGKKYGIHCFLYRDRRTRLYRRALRIERLTAPHNFMTVTQLPSLGQLRLLLTPQIFLYTLTPFDKSPLS